MKKTNLLKVLLVFSCLVTSVSCGETNSSASQQEQNELVFEDKVVTYDGNKHSIELESVPAGATVKYVGNEKVEPGIYTVRAKVSYPDGTSKSVSAKLTIEKIEKNAFLGCDNLKVLVGTSVQEEYLNVASDWASKVVIDSVGNERLLDVVLLKRACLGSSEYVEIN